MVASLKLITMKSLFTLTILSLLSFSIVPAQERHHPIITPFGGIYDIPEATVKADSKLDYNIVIDVVTGNDNPEEINWSLNNVARLLNLHAISGADREKINVVVAIHGGATMAIVNDKAYQKKYGIDNPNDNLITALADAGVVLTVCGQSLISRGIDSSDINKSVQVATSMLTTVTTYQLKGYAFLKF